MSKIHPFFDPMPRIVAHRGDSGSFPENTLLAFESAVKMNVDVIETDVHISKDGAIVIWHDPTLDRNTDATGRIEDHTLAELKEFDAGYTFTLDGGVTYPFRGKGVHLATLEEALEAFPTTRFNVDLKSKEETIVAAFIKLITKHDAFDRVVGASFHLKNLKALRKAEKRIQTSLTTLEVLPLLAKQKLGVLSSKKQKDLTIFQVPPRQWGIEVVTPRFVEIMHKRGAIIQVWTINEREEMKRLLQMGVDSIMTDHPLIALEVAKELGFR